MDTLVNIYLLYLSFYPSIIDSFIPWRGPLGPGGGGVTGHQLIARPAY